MKKLNIAWNIMIEKSHAAQPENFFSEKVIGEIGIKNRKYEGKTFKI